jgi:hypothetical protein
VRSECPDASQERAIAASVGALKDLIERGCVQLVWWNPQDDSDLPVDPEHAAQLLQDQRSWEPPRDLRTPQLRFIATGSPPCSPARM